VFKDSAAKTDAWPIVFTKVPESVVGPHDDVRLPAELSSQIDYEAELAVVIGKGGRSSQRRRGANHDRRHRGDREPLRLNRAQTT